MTEPAQTSRTTKLTCRLQGIRICHSDICHCSTRIILIQRQLKRSQHRKCSSPSLNCPKAGHKISLCEGVSPPLCNIIRDRPYSANPYLPLILPVYLLSLNLQTLGTQNFFFFLATSAASRSSQARDPTYITVVTQATAVTIPGP